MNVIEYKRRKRMEMIDWMTSQNQVKMRSWRKRIMEKANLRVIKKELWYDDCFICDFFCLDKHARSVIIKAVLYTIQHEHKHDEEYDF